MAAAPCSDHCTRYSTYAVPLACAAAAGLDVTHRSMGGDAGADWEGVEGGVGRGVIGVSVVPSRQQDVPKQCEYNGLLYSALTKVVKTSLTDSDTSPQSRGIAFDSLFRADPEIAIALASHLKG